MVPVDAVTLMTASDAVLGGVGLSAAKVRTLRAAAGAVLNGSLPLDALADLPSDVARRPLLAVPGIGPWTADVFLLFCPGEPDIFPAGDLALQEGHRLVFGGVRPSTAALEALATRWSPWRGVAAYCLWSCYSALRGTATSPVPTNT